MILAGITLYKANFSKLFAKVHGSKAGALGVVLPLVLTSCAPVAAAEMDRPVANAPVFDLEVHPRWVEPDWMEPARREVNRFQLELMECLAEQGIVGIPSIGTGDVGINIPVNSDGNFDSQLWEFYQSTSESCRLAIQHPSHFPQPPDWVVLRTPEAYARMLDVRACLVAHGQNLREPPAESSWVLSTAPWNPWHHVELGAGGSSEPLRQLMESCPQDGVSLPISFSVFD